MKATHCLSLAMWALVAAGCAVGKPVGFGKGESWSIPVVGALDDAHFVTAVMIQGRGPYLFVINPRSKSLIHRDLAKELNLYVYRTDDGLTDSHDHVYQEITDHAEILQLSVGDLTVDKRTFMVRDALATFRGQPILGTLGGDVFAESLVWTFDRDRQMVYLSTQEMAPARPADAIEIEAERVRYGKMFVEARLNDRQKAYVYVNFGSAGSAVWPQVAERAGLEPMATGVWRADTIALGAAAVEGLPVYRFEDARVREQDYDGFIGWDVLSRFRVTVNWHEQTLWLQPRARDLTEHRDERLRRWGDWFAGCDRPACVTARVGREDDEPFVEFSHDARSNAVGFDALVEALDETGAPLPLPRLMVAFAPGTNVAGVRGPDAARYQAAADFRVLDASPFPPPCDGGCVLYAQ